MRAPEAPVFDPSAFDESFFANYEMQPVDMGVEDQASAALAGILTVEQADGTQKTYEQIRDESRAFFANDWVRESEALMDRLAVEFVHQCMDNAYGSELARDDQLGSVFEKGVVSLYGENDRTHDGHAHNKKDNKDKEADKKKKKKDKKKDLFGLLFRKAAKK